MSGQLKLCFCTRSGKESLSSRAVLSGQERQDGEGERALALESDRLGSSPRMTLTTQVVSV